MVPVCRYLKNQAYKNSSTALTGGQNMVFSPTTVGHHTSLHGLSRTTKIDVMRLLQVYTKC
eukprot:UN05729